MSILTSCQLERISSRNVIHVNTEPKTRSCNTLKSMSLVCQNAEDNAYVMVEICLGLTIFFKHIDFIFLCFRSAIPFPCLCM